MTSQFYYIFVLETILLKSFEFFYAFFFRRDVTYFYKIWFWIIPLHSTEFTFKILNQIFLILYLFIELFELIVI